jgi:ATP/maltotriose-dependent transcriptional regulator MalT
MRIVRLVQHRRDLPTTILTRVRPPRERSGMLPRRSLVDRVFEAADAKRITLVTAPSGYGKTTLLAATFRRFDDLGIPHVWLSVSEADRDPLWIDRVLIGLTAEQLGTHKQGDEDFVGFIHRVVKDNRIIVLIDNWNYIESDAVNSYFDQILRETHGLVHFVVSSQKTPGFVHEVYKLEDDFASFNVRDLAFTTAEALEFLSGSTSGADAETLRTLVEKTEGWPAGVQLLRLALNQLGQRAIDELQFSGTRADVADYLNKTLFRQYSVSQRRLLCDLSVVDYLNEELVVFITGDRRAAAEFADLTRENVFLIETRDGSAVYRFHSLFRDFLLSQRVNEETRPPDEILRRAAAWHETRDETSQAIVYSLRAADGPASKRLLERYAEQRLVGDGNLMLFCEWIATLLRLGEALSPILEHWYRWSLVFSGRWAAARNVQTTDSNARTALVDAVIAVFGDDQEALVGALERSTAGANGSDPFNLASTRALSSIASTARGDLNGAFQHIIRAKFSIEQTESAFGRTWALILMGLVCLLRGRTDEAETAIAEAADLVSRHSGFTSQVGWVTQTVRAIIAHQRGDDRETAAVLSSLRRIEGERNLPFVAVWTAAIARTLGVDWVGLGSENPPNSPAVALLAEAFEVEAAMQRCSDATTIGRLHETFEIRLASFAADNPNLQANGWCLRDLIVALACRALIWRGESEAAIRRLNQAIGDCQRQGRGLMQQKLTLLKVAAILRQGKQPAALRLLIQTAETAVRSRLFRFFKDEERFIGELFPALFDAGERAPLGNDPVGWRRFVAFLRNADPDAAAVDRKTSDALEHFTPSAREADMLRFLDAGLSNKEIGERLGISVPTVKWYLHNLFSRMGVKNRSSAVRTARDHRMI